MAEPVIVIHGSETAMPKALVRQADGLVANIIVYDPALNWQPPEGHILVDLPGAPIGPGDLYLGGRFVRAEISASTNKVQVLANDSDPVTITARLPLPEQATLELWVDGVKRAEAITDAQGQAQFVLTFAESGLYHIEVRDTTPPLPGQPQPTKYRSAFLVVEAVQP